MENIKMTFVEKQELFWDIFYRLHFEKLGDRKYCFENIFKYLLNKQQDSYLIIETGTIRMENDYGAGMSTVLWDIFLNYFNGKCISIDNNIDVINFAKNVVSDHVELVCEDSVRYLNELSLSSISQIDVLYLDSHDIDWYNPHPSSLHHLKELCAIKNKITNGTLVCVDDNQGSHGKGWYINDFMTTLNKNKICDSYQLAWVW